MDLWDNIRLYSKDEAGKGFGSSVTLESHEAATIESRTAEVSQ